MVRIEYKSNGTGWMWVFCANVPAPERKGSGRKYLAHGAFYATRAWFKGLIHGIGENELRVRRSKLRLSWQTPLYHSLLAGPSDHHCHASLPQSQPGKTQFATRNLALHTFTCEGLTEHRLQIQAY